VPILSPTFYADVSIDATRRFAVPAKHEERGVYVVEGSIGAGRESAGPGELLVLESGAEVLLQAHSSARVLVFGGASVGPRHVWWNFVSSRKERIAQASADWEAGRFALVPGDPEFIPLPRP
jgi:redox-sensitive bicupin YhaK (pirin superfamily)